MSKEPKVGPEDERIALRCNRRELQLVDSFVVNGEFRNRSELMRHALRAFLRDRSASAVTAPAPAASESGVLEVPVRLRREEIETYRAYRRDRGERPGPGGPPRPAGSPRRGSSSRSWKRSPEPAPRSETRPRRRTDTGAGTKCGGAGAAGGRRPVGSQTSRIREKRVGAMYEREERNGERGDEFGAGEGYGSDGLENPPARAGHSIRAGRCRRRWDPGGPCRRPAPLALSGNRRHQLRSASPGTRGVRPADLPRSRERSPPGDGGLAPGGRPVRSLGGTGASSGSSREPPSSRSSPVWEAARAPVRFRSSSRRRRAAPPR